MELERSTIGQRPGGGTQFCSRAVSGLPSSTVCFVRLLDLVLTKDLAEKGRSKMPPEMVEDPVCGMRIDPDDAAGTAEYEGKRYYFCSETCHDAFVANPATYV